LGGHASGEVSVDRRTCDILTSASMTFLVRRGIFRGPVDNPTRPVVNPPGSTPLGRAADDRQSRHRIGPVTPRQRGRRGGPERPVRPAPRPAQADGADPPRPPTPGARRCVRRPPGGPHRGAPPRRGVRPRARAARVPLVPLPRRRAAVARPPPPPGG